jgi:hypothetical protein
MGLRLGLGLELGLVLRLGIRRELEVGFGLAHDRVRVGLGIG